MSRWSDVIVFLPVLIFEMHQSDIKMNSVVGFLGYPQPGGGAHPPIPSEGGLGEVLWRLGRSSFETSTQEHMI